MKVPGSNPPRVFRSDHRGSSPEWGYGPPKKKKKLPGLLDAIAHLKARGLTGIEVIGAYHERRVMLMMARGIPLYSMDPQLAHPGI
ncbi:uncharacterized protein C2845_PMPSC055388 [Panicum miliaceum]|uniref:Uncharacterized protein n=1 Tax=Panicum miliaceum TaxID=4540 RepID=A0A3L6PCP5_PANMI|nr:uncharacterized protein C2845_PMPSC055388 [Panicum miliaceum]